MTSKFSIPKHPAETPSHRGIVPDCYGGTAHPGDSLCAVLFIAAKAAPANVGGIAILAYGRGGDERLILRAVGDCLARRIRGILRRYNNRSRADSMSAAALGRES